CHLFYPDQSGLAVCRRRAVGHRRLALSLGRPICLRGRCPPRSETVNLGRLAETAGDEGMLQYLDLVRRVLADGVEARDPTGTGTLAVFGHQLRFDRGRGFPMVATKKLH